MHRNDLRSYELLKKKIHPASTIVSFNVLCFGFLLNKSSKVLVILNLVKHCSKQMPHGLSLSRWYKSLLPQPRFGLFLSFATPTS